MHRNDATAGFLGGCVMKLDVRAHAAIVSQHHWPSEVRDFGVAQPGPDRQQHNDAVAVGVSCCSAKTRRSSKFSCDSIFAVEHVHVNDGGQAVIGNFQSKRSQ